MPDSEPIVRHISDTALWAAVFRARETERPDALFRDPFATRLAGTRGFAIADALSEERHHLSWVVRTYLFDQYIVREIHQGVDMIVNLAAGLDARPYRMTLPSSLKWVEVDFPEILAYKDQVLADEKPTCGLQRIPLDLLECDSRRSLFVDLNRQANKILVLTEGLLVYLSPEEVAALANDLVANTHFQHWILDVISPGVLDTMQRTTGQQFGQVAASYKFGPAEGPPFFARYGWELMDVRGVLKTAVVLNRTPIDPRLLDLIPDFPRGAQSDFPWVGVCLFKRAE